jgi:hypothetical protein
VKSSIQSYLESSDIRLNYKQSDNLPTTSGKLTFKSSSQATSDLKFYS